MSPRFQSRMPLPSRLWLAIRVLRGQIVSAQWVTDNGAGDTTTITFVGLLDHTKREER